MSSFDLEYRIGKVNIDPGDVLVLKTKRELSQEQAGNLREIMKRAVPGVKALILTGDLDLSVLTGEELKRCLRDMPEQHAHVSPDDQEKRKPESLPA